MQTRDMGTNHSVSEYASSTHPGDWGRAMACATSRLAELCDADPQSDHEGLLGRELHLVITPSGDGVDITLSCSAPTP